MYLAEHKIEHKMMCGRLLFYSHNHEVLFELIIVVSLIIPMSCVMLQYGRKK